MKKADSPGEPKCEGGGAGSQHEEGCPCPRVRAWMGVQPPSMERARWGSRPLLQDEDPCSSTQQTRNLQSRAPQPMPTAPQSHHATGWDATTTFSSLDGQAGARTCSGSPGGRGPVPRRSGRQLVPGKAPSAGCVNPIRNSISKLPVAKGSAAPCAGSARGRGDWCRRVHVTDPSLSSCPKMGSSSHEQAAVPHRAADKQKTDSISTK